MRTFQATGDLNPSHTTKKRKSSFTIANGVIEELEADTPDPNGLLQCLDGLEANRWAMLWAQLGPEFAVDRWIQWLVVKFRSHGDKLFAAKRLYDAASWKVALLMRNNRDFKEATEAVMSDLVFVNEQLTAPPPAWAAAASLPASSGGRDPHVVQPQVQKRPKGSSK
eukprot:6468148-Amphidinium_carterae.1